MGSNIRELNKIFVIFEEIKNNRVGHLLQSVYIQRTVFLDGLKCIVDRADCFDACLFFDYVGRRRQFIFRVHGSYGHRLNAELVQFTDIIDCNRLTLDKITASCSIEQTLSKNHTAL